jgi:hypothetical protein
LLGVEPLLAGSALELRAPRLEVDPRQSGAARDATARTGGRVNLPDTQGVIAPASAVGLTAPTGARAVTDQAGAHSLTDPAGASGPTDRAGARGLTDPAAASGPTDRAGARGLTDPAAASGPTDLAGARGRGPLASDPAFDYLMLAAALQPVDQSQATPDEPENETAGVQATPDRASIRVRIVGALEQIGPAVSQAVSQISIPSTGGPAAAALLIGLAALGAAGFWLRDSGRRPSA